MAVSRFWFGLVLMSLLVCATDCRRPSSSKPAEVQKPVVTTPTITSPTPTTPPPPAPPAAPAKEKEKDAAKGDSHEESDGTPAPKSWDDPRVLAELTKNCAFDPESLPASERKQWLGEHDEGDGDSPLSCTASMEQSCVYDPCHDEQSRQCNPRCESKCRSCGKTCADKCEKCKTPCQDDACRMACAKKCASCHETCVRKRDRCATGTCTEEYKKCRVKLRDEWTANGCTEICETHSACKTACEEKNEKAKKKKDCDKACPTPKGADKCDLLLCKNEESMGIDPTSTTD